MKKLLRSSVVVGVTTFLIIMPGFRLKRAIAQSSIQEQSSELAQRVKDSQFDIEFKDACMNAPIPFDVEISQSMRSRFCGCWLNFVKTHLSEEEIIKFGTILLDNPQELLNEPELFRIIGIGLQGCVEQTTGFANQQEEQNIDINRLEEEFKKLRDCLFSKSQVSFGWEKGKKRKKRPHYPTVKRQ